MPRQGLPDDITKTLLDRYVTVLSVLSGWGQNTDLSKAIYPNLGYPFPQEPFPCGHIYVNGIQIDMTQGSGLRRDVYNIVVRVLGGPATPGYSSNPETLVYTLLTGVLNELTYRPYLQDPTNNNDPFRYIDPDKHLTLGNPSRITNFQYGEQGGFIGIEVPTTLVLNFNVGRVS